MIECGFQGELYPVNPKADEILGRRCYQSIAKVPGDVDLAVIVVPARLVPDVAKECGRKGARGLVVISAGFSETGAEGLRLERELVKVCKEYGMRMLGPNCLGIISTWARVNASFSGANPLSGKIALISQSGALGSAILNWALQENIGLANFISVGNEADLTSTDFIDALGKDERVRVLGLYVEGVKDGERFMDVCRRVARRKPIVALKSGTTEVGVRAVLSHTGSLAGSDAAFTAACRKAGLIRAGTLEGLFDLVRGFGTQPPLGGKGILILTNGGGPGILAADACENEGLELPSLEYEIQEKLRRSMPPHASVHNPVDILGDADARRYSIGLELGLSSERISGAIVIVTPQAMTPAEEIAMEIVGARKRFPHKPVLPVFMGAGNGPISILEKNDLPNYEFPESAASVLKGMYDHSLIILSPEDEIPIIEGVDDEAVQNVIARARGDRRVNLSIDECMAVAGAYGIPVPAGRIVGSPEEAVDAAEQIGYPVVLKVVSPEVIHKTDVGGVVLNISTPGEVRRNYEAILRRVRAAIPRGSISGVLVSKMVPRGKEVIVGAVRDVQFGPVVMFGLGGIYVDFLRDVSHRLCPVTRREAEEMIGETKAHALLRGVRGEPPSDIGSVVDVILRVSQLMRRFREIVEMEVNPLCVYEEGKGCLAVDIRMTVAE
jgi:acetyltransferase